MRGCVSARRPTAIARYAEAVTPFQPLVSGTEIVSAFLLPTPSRRNSLGKRTRRKSSDGESAVRDRRLPISPIRDWRTRGIDPLQWQTTAG